MATNREVVPAEKNSGEREPLAQRDETRTTLISMGAMLTGRRWRLAARWIGLLILVIGATLLAFVFVEALRGFSRLSKPGYIQNEVNTIAGDAWTELVTAYVSVLGAEFFRLLYLLLLGVLGSLIASKGIQFFSASESVIDEAVVGMEEDV
jgi:hypothetical protein